MILNWFSDDYDSDVEEGNGFFIKRRKDINYRNDLDKFDLIFMSNQSLISQEMRKQIQKLHNHYTFVKSFDAGYLLNNDYRFVFQPLQICNELNKISFICGGSLALANSIHEKNSYKVTYIGNSLLPFEQHSENQSFLGYQRHLCDYRSLKYVEEFCPDSLSLGQMKSHPHLIEPILRDTEVLYVNLNVLRTSELPNSGDSWPSGLITEDLCQILKFAGNSLRLKSIIIDFSGIVPSENNSEAKLIAELYWYLLEGMRMRQSDHPIFNSNVSEYVVQISDYDTEIVFIKSNISQRWWLRLEEGENIPYVSCAHEEYQLSIQNEIPERLMRFIV
ncbi:MAG: hypothetical protein IPL63_15340 [Saprospiraceae bacterium]|nr:hypothetical protein [Saprospiraceae bacterium]MBK6564968.1 hypothetical protein [Saprospiraceae bacterium]MBK7523606.1 hypothetical protein [Saprospiraceae bacterium]MBK8371403.1 hypothetical protein [Saprospiraceae bacterium]MBK8548669.1 hypothetical protein [Saprospiraceae bacterium]